ncbi:MAG: molybdopterin molybdotransferase MoeA [Candidatus Hadarchaeales archaeon]
MQGSRWKGFREYLAVEEALRLILSSSKPLGPEEIPLEKACGRILFEDLLSPIHFPPFDRSAVDGYAVRASDTFGASESSPRRLKVVGGRVGPGRAVEVMTGRPLPPEADAVVMVEHTRRRGKEVEILLPVTPGKNVSTRGEDVRKGERVLEKGRRLGPQEVGMLACLGFRRVRVFRRPRVSILSTGSELREPGQRLKKGEIPDINSYSLACAVRSCGALPILLGRCPDEKKELGRKLEEGTKRAEVMLVSGGTSVGKEDLVPEVLRERGELLFHGINLRPGGPTAFGRIDGKPIFCLPGFPAACLLSYTFLVRPFLRFLQGLPPERGLRKVKARVSRRVASSLGRVDVVRVRLLKGEGGLWAEPLRVTGSGILSSLTGSDGFFVIPEDTEVVEKGEEVEVELWD